MLDFKKSGKTRIQMIQNEDGDFVVRKCVNRKWEVSLCTDNKAVAESWFYWLVLLHTEQLKYIHEY